MDFIYIVNEMSSTSISCTATFEILNSAHIIFFQGLQILYLKDTVFFPNIMQITNPIGPFMI
jgi:hypothetical protein